MLKSKTSIERSDKSKSPDYVYLNINIMNSAQGQTFFSNNPVVRYTDTLQSNVVDNPSDYLFYISRFSCESGLLLPIWKPEIVDGQSDMNLCVYSITMTVTSGGTVYTQTTHMTYEPETNAGAPPNNNLTSDTNHYFYTYTFTHIAYLFNNMVQTCYNALQTQAGVEFTAQCPFINYDPTSSLFSLYFDKSNEQFGMSFDNNLYNMFYSFYFRNNNQLVINNSAINNVTINNIIYTKVTQDFVSTSMWSPIASLVFTTSKIPIVSEQSTQPLTFGENSNINVSSNNAQRYQQIITDITIPSDKSSDWRSYITYVPAYPRYINLNSVSELKDIDISLFFMDKNSGNLIPVRISNGGIINLKLSFKHKSVN